MQSQLYRVVCVLMYVLSLFIVPTHVVAYADYGPQLDPVIIDESPRALISITCPPSISYGCTENDTLTTFAEFEAAGGSVNIPSECSVIEFTHTGDFFLGGDDCVQTYNRGYQIKTDCGSTFNCGQLVMIGDQSPPTISCPANIVLSVSTRCDTTYTPVMATAEDDCGIQDISHDAPIVFPMGVTTVTYTAIDMCGQIATCTSSVTVLDGANPEIICPPNLNVSCSIDEATPYSTAAEFEAAGGIIIDCSPVEDISISSEDNSDGGSCPETVTRTYTLTDANNNSSTCDQVITIRNIVPPTFTLPVAISGVSCSDIDNLAITGDVSNISTTCGGTSTSSYSDTVTDNGGGSLTIIRTFTVTDECGVEASGIQTIGVMDTERPTAICRDITLYLNANGEAVIIPDSLDGGSFDDCTPIDELVFTAGTDILRCNDATFVSPQLIELYVTDAAGLRDTCESLITILDTIAPVIINPPNDTVTCIADIPGTLNMTEFQLAGGIIEDNCLGTLSFDSETAITGDCPSMLTRTYEYNDIHGDMVGTAMHTIIILDEVAPSIICPSDITITETDICDTLLNINVSATDGCGSVTISNNLNSEGGSFSERFSGGVTPIEFIATDPCGNMDTCIMTITVLAPAKITFPPLDFTCATELPDYTDFQMFEDAGGSININCGIDVSTFDYDASFVINETDSCIATVKEIVSFGSGADMCRDSVVTTLIDSVGPEITCLGTPVIFAMQNPETCLPVITSTPPFAKDNFGVISDITLSPVNMTLGEETAYWIATDACGNTDSCQVTVNMFDGTSPLFRIDTAEILCPIDIPQFSSLNQFLDYSDKAIAEDCNLDPSSFDFVKDTIVNGLPGKVYFIEDSVGNMSTVVHFYNLLDSEAPVFTPSSMSDQFDIADATSCVKALSFTAPTPTDDHGIDTMYTLIDGVLHSSFDITSYEFSIGVTDISHIVRDSCGRADTVSFEVTINDTSSPIFSIPDTSFFCASMFPTFGSLNEFLAFTPDAVASDCSLDPTSFEFLGDVLDGDGVVIGKRYELCDVLDQCSIITHNLSATDMEGPVFDSLPDPISPINCGDPLPDHEVLTATDDMSGVLTVEFDTVPYIPNLCIDQDITYIWIATDHCGNERRDSLTFVKLRDDVPPTADLFSSTIQVSNAAGLCSGLLSELTPPIYTDDCSGMDTVYSTHIVDILPIGDNIIEWVGVDNCGNRDTVTQLVQVEDREVPTIVCDSLVSINLTDEHSNLANVSSFVKNYDDNCGVANVEARRIIEVCDDPLSDEFGDVVRFCCAEVGDTVMVEVRITDVNGLVNTCISGAVISDKLAPSITYNLPDITVNCGYYIDTTDLSEFGVYVYDIADRDSIFVDAPAYDGTNNFAGLDGVINENCSASQSDSVVVNIDDCNVGTIERFTTITDDSGNEVIAKQTISVENYNPFFIDRSDHESSDDDIIWPETFEWDGCLNPAPDSTIAGAPVILNEDQCSQVVAIYSDLSFDIGNGGCSYIRRRWKVIDWCQYDDAQTPNPGEWTYNQDIYVNNTTPPRFTNETSVDSVVCAVGSLCESPLNLVVTATDDCTDSTKLLYSYEIDVLNDGNVNYSGSGNTINSELLPLGTHKVTWMVTDLCGNSNERIDLYTIRDCKLPTIVCIDGLSIGLGEDGTVTTWASDLVKEVYDNCTSKEDLKLSFSDDPDDFGQTFSTVGAHVVNIWVTDLAGNQSFCSTTINIQDNDALNGGNTTSIMGRILSPEGIAIKDSKVNIAGAELSDYDMTDQSGGYAFMEIEAETDIEVTVDREDDYITGVNTLDIVKIKRHMLGLEMLDSPYKMIAADATNDEQITTADLLTLRKLVLGLVDHLPENKSWRFIKNESIQNGNNPWPFEEHDYIGFGEYETESDFVGVKIGDVDYSIENLLDGDLTSRSAKYIGLVTSDQSFKKGEIRDIPLNISNDFVLQGIQFTVEYNTKKLKFVGINGGTLDIEKKHVGVHTDGAVTLSYDSRSPLNINKLDELMTLRFEVVEEGTIAENLKINSKFTDAAAFDNQDNLYEVNLDFVTSSLKTFALQQNRPNPFFDQTTIAFNLPEDMEIELLLFDSTGKIMNRSTVVYPAGTNTLVIGQELEGRKGVFYLKMDAAEYSEVIKMIKL